MPKCYRHQHFIQWFLLNLLEGNEHFISFVVFFLVIFVPCVFLIFVYSRDQTYEGALYRAESAKKTHIDCDLWIGIENGIFKEGEVWMDAASIVVIGNQNKFGNERRWSLWSDSIQVDHDMQKGRNGEWSILKDPHIVITKGKRSRIDFIADALIQWKSKVNLE